MSNVKLPTGADNDKNMQESVRNDVASNWFVLMIKEADPKSFIIIGSCSYAVGLFCKDNYQQHKQIQVKELN